MDKFDKLGHTIYQHIRKLGFTQSKNSSDIFIQPPFFIGIRKYDRTQIYEIQSLTDDNTNSYRFDMEHIKNILLISHDTEVIDIQKSLLGDNFKIFTRNKKLNYLKDKINEKERINN